MTLHAFKIVGVFATLLPYTVMGQAPASGETKVGSFNPDLHIPFKTYGQESSVQVVSRTEKEVISLLEDKIFQAVKDEKLTPYRSLSMEDEMALESLDQFDKGGGRYFFVSTEWKLMNSRNYARPVAISIGQLLSRRLEKKIIRKKLAIDVEELEQFLSAEETEKLSGIYFRKGLKKAFGEINKNKQIPDVKLSDDMQTVRFIPWQVKESPVKAYINLKHSRIHNKLNKMVHKGKLEAYKTPALKRSLSDKELKEKCRGNKKTITIRPEPIERPTYTEDSTIMEKCHPKKVNEYLVAEKWEKLKGEMFGYRPEVKALAPLVFTHSKKMGKRVFYWLKWEEAKKHLPNEDVLWLKRYLLFNLKNSMSGM